MFIYAYMYYIHICKENRKRWLINIGLSVFKQSNLRSVFASRQVSGAWKCPRGRSLQKRRSGWDIRIICTQYIYMCICVYVLYAKAAKVVLDRLWRAWAAIEKVPGRSNRDVYRHDWVPIPQDTLQTYQSMSSCLITTAIGDLQGHQSIYTNIYVYMYIYLCIYIYI